jgi:hypothetical protein
MKESFDIQFSYHGINYSGTVTQGERENDLLYSVSYTMEPGKRFEQTIVLGESATDETGNFEWIQKTEEAGQMGADPGFIQIIGEAIEDSEG